MNEFLEWLFEKVSNCWLRRAGSNCDTRLNKFQEQFFAEISNFCYSMCMIELLILYSLNKRERTLYSLRADIIEKFGSFTKPSIGTIHPALKRLLENNVVTIRNDYSEGGKKSTFYGLALHWQKKFRDLFFTPMSDNPTNFFTELQTRIAVLSLLDKELKETFFEDVAIKLESNRLDLENTLDDEYIALDVYQKGVLKRNITEIENIQKLLKDLRGN